MSDWYKPNKPNKKKHIGILILLTVVVTLAIAVGVLSYLVFSGKVMLAAVSNNSGTSPQLPDDFKDYMGSFYTTTQTDYTDVKITEYPGKIAYEMDLIEDDGNKLSLQDLYKKCSPYIVSISASKDGEKYSYWGSGIVISPDGLILTNTHIIDGCKYAYVQLYDKTRYDATLVAADAVSDVALLKIEPDNELNYASFADSTSIQVGDEVAAIGCPLGETFRNTLTNGIISAIERGITYNGHIMTLLQTNTALNEGNSGGALFNMSGHVIGITNMKMSSSYSSIEGIAFAIPSATVQSIVEDLLANGYVERTSIGIIVGSIPANILKHYDLPKGIYVSEVIEGSGADTAGIKVGDIIIKAENEEIDNLAEINEIKDTLGVGDKIQLTIYRDGQTFDVSVVLSTAQK